MHQSTLRSAQAQRGLRGGPTAGCPYGPYPQAIVAALFILSKIKACHHTFCMVHYS